MPAAARSPAFFAGAIGNRRRAGSNRSVGCRRVAILTVRAAVSLEDTHPRAWPAPKDAFVLAFAAGDAYASDNFRWFERWHAGFLYVDRIVVDASHRRRGVARAAYAELAAAARGRFAALVCEVNLAPPNPGSLTFHQACGFRSLCARDNRHSAKRVLMLRKALY